MTAGYAETIRHHARATILRLLAEQPDYALNESILRDLLLPFGFALSRDQMRGELTWLEEQGMVSIETVASVMVAKVTGRGVDVGSGRATHPGVKRPGP
jgi:hypothetical protein